jgi:K+-sensing histidine kinase KdpD
MVLPKKGKVRILSRSAALHSMKDSDLEELHRSFRKLSHDVRSPLTSILGLAEITLEDPSLSEDSRENLQLLVADAVRLSEMTVNMLDDIESRFFTGRDSAE